MSARNLCIIMYVHQIIELSVLSSTLSLFLDFCYRDGNILGWWLESLAKFFIGKPNDPGKDKIEADGFLDYRDWWFDKANKSFWFKPLGSCVVCANVWHSALLCFLGGYFVSTVYWVYAIPIILLSNFIVRFFHDKLT